MSWSKQTIGPWLMWGADCCVGKAGLPSKHLGGGRRGIWVHKVYCNPSGAKMMCFSAYYNLATTALWIIAILPGLLPAGMLFSVVGWDKWKILKCFTLLFPAVSPFFHLLSTIPPAFHSLSISVLLKMSQMQRRQAWCKLLAAHSLKKASPT